MMFFRAKWHWHRLTGLTKICFGRLTGCAAAYAGAKRCQRHAGPRPPLASAVTRRCLGLDAPAAQRLGKRLAKSKQILAAWVEPLAVQSLGLDGQMHVRSRRVRMRSEEHTPELPSLMPHSSAVCWLTQHT